MADMTTQRYEVGIVPGPEGDPVIQKAHIPGTYEFDNEVRWLGWMASNDFETFTVPGIVSTDLLSGVIQMEYIKGEPASEATRAQVITAAQELHTSISSPTATTRRGRFAATDFPGYLVSTVDARAAQLEQNGIDLSTTLAGDVRRAIESLDCVGGFGYTHKDLRYRHALVRADGKPVALIDWEFGNVVHPAQDLAKLVYDRRDQATRPNRTTNGHTGLGLPDIVEDTVKLYVAAGGHPSYSDEALLEAVWRLYPLAPIERARSLLDRKPERYREEVERDLGLVEEWREVAPVA